MNIKNYKNSIASSLVIAVFLFSFLITFLSTAIFLYTGYRNYIKTIEQNFEHIRLSHAPSVAESLWTMDMKHLQTMLNGLVHSTNADYVEVGAEGRIILSAGEIKSGKVMERNFVLSYNYNGKNMFLGYLHVKKATDEIYGLLKKDFSRILLGQGLQIFALSFFVLLIVQRMATRHLVSIAKHIGEIKLGSSTEPIVLKRRHNKSSGQDELSLVVNAINAMSSELNEAFKNLETELNRRRQSENALRKSESQLSEAQRLTHIGSWDLIYSTGEVHWSDETYRMLGVSRHELSPTFKDVLELIHPADINNFEEAVRDMITSKRELNIEHRIIRSDGEVLTVISQGKVEYGSSGEPVKIIGTIHDITERRRTEEFIENILHTVDEGFIVVDRDFRIVSANRAYCEHVNLSFDGIVGKKCYEVSHKLARPCYESGEECAVQHTFKTGTPHVSVHRHEIKLGDGGFNIKHVETKAYPVRDSSGNIVSVIEIINDISEKIRIEEQLRQSQKMEAIGVLAGGIAHDFNNILTAIMGYGKLLGMKMPDDNPLKAYVQQIIDSAVRAATLTKSLLTFSRKQTINPAPVDLNDILRGIEKLLIRIIGEDIELLTRFSEGSLVVLADKGQVEQVIMNLVTNARDAMPEGGLLTIESDIVDISEHFIKKHGYGRTGEYALISVADTGTGMDDNTRQRIFEPFFTTKDVGQGTGLGLAMVYGMIKQNRGYIHVYSEPGKGTTFKIYFPLIKAAAADTETKVQVTARGGDETILLAEDDESLRRLAVTMLKEYGYTVKEAKNGDDAVSIFMENKEKVKLLIFDVIMPKKNGRDAYEEIRKIKDDIKIIFISGYTADIVGRKGLIEPGLNFLTKPLSPETFLCKVREVLDSGT